MCIALRCEHFYSSRRPLCQSEAKSNGPRVLKNAICDGKQFFMREALPRGGSSLFNYFFILFYTHPFAFLLRYVLAVTRIAEARIGALLKHDVRINWTIRLFLLFYIFMPRF